MTAVERDGPCSIERTTDGHYRFRCHDCRYSSPSCWSRRVAEDLYDRHTHQEEG